MGSMRPMSGMQRPDPLTDEQKTKVKDLLSQYDSENLTVEDAKSLFKSIQEAGIKGPGLRDAIQEAGFDADKVWSLWRMMARIHRRKATLGTRAKLIHLLFRP